MLSKVRRKNTTFSCKANHKGVFTLGIDVNFEYLNAEFLHKSVGEFYGAVYDKAMTSVIDFLNAEETFTDAQEYVQAVGILALRAFASQLDLNSHISHVPVIQDRIKGSSPTSKYEDIDCNRQELVTNILYAEGTGSVTSDDENLSSRLPIPLRQ